MALLTHPAALDDTSFQGRLFPTAPRGAAVRSGFPIGA